VDSTYSRRLAVLKTCIRIIAHESARVSVALHAERYAIGYIDATADVFYFELVLAR